ncbi:protein O-mannose kinase-like isoform X2 [Portunus trituberculatus]|uniref:protein O-mannose kinase-like isoform X2 n=1 Tax=Portunus trituberculatus TaxID=210409 RepID=UPI001E1D0A35|nr:protein O-mannose kinase-like isoform X2 [Portunus trituberculatus]
MESQGFQLVKKKKAARPRSKQVIQNMVSSPQHNKCECLDLPGPLMMCDSSTLIKTLEQYLLTTSGNLVLNDVDSLARVMEGGTVCGHQELKGDFVAPEQKWPFDGDEYRTERMPPYSEKADIWKIPPVCNFFLGNSDGARTLRYHLHSIHRRCREKEPHRRPTAHEVLWSYEALSWSYFRKKAEGNEEL